VYADETDFVSMLESSEGGNIAPCIGVSDHYDHWAKNDYSPAAAKPLWLTKNNTEVQHIFFDDNIHNDSSDSIVAVRSRETADLAFTPLSGADTLLEHGVHLVRTPTICPILDQDWFLKQVAACEANWLARQ